MHRRVMSPRGRGSPWRSAAGGAEPPGSQPAAANNRPLQQPCLCSAGGQPGQRRVAGPFRGLVASGAGQCGTDVGVMHRTGEKSRAGWRESCPAALRSSSGRVVLRVLTENGQQQQRPGSQGAAVIKRFSGFENTIISCRKDEVPNCIISAASKQGFAVYIDDSEDKENYSCQVSEELELSHCELDTSAMTSSIHRLLDLSSGSPMVVEDVVTLAVGEYAEDIH
ncbi:cyclin-A1-like [Molothrus ater]|uniref:cyclin-A1-like n=1 Tax=Molothrus ater TaxID=84834 RepID=UPI00174B12A2|nr:cyclin-A1-like [Molothrus ater]